MHNTHNYGNVFIEYGIYDIEELPVDVKTNVNTCSVEHLLEKCYGRNVLKHIEAINPTEQMESSMAIRGNALYLFGSRTYDDPLFWHASRIWSWCLTSDYRLLDLDNTISKEAFYK